MIIQNLTLCGNLFCTIGKALGWNSTLINTGFSSRWP
jgi:hypothetical protein